MTIEIPLTKGYVAVIDDEDAHLSEFKWSARIDRCGIVYAHRQIVRDGKRTTSLLHREVMALSPGDPLVDHRDGDGLNCRRYNLRLSTRSQNAFNRAEPQPTNKNSPYRGVSYVKRTGKFSANISMNGKRTYLGQYKTADEAFAARLAEERKYVIEPRRTHLHD